MPKFARLCGGIRRPGNIAPSAYLNNLDFGAALAVDRALIAGGEVAKEQHGECQTNELNFEHETCSLR